MNAHETGHQELASAEKAIRAAFDAGARVRDCGVKMPTLAFYIETAMAPHLANTTYSNYWRAGFVAGFLGILPPTPGEVDRVAL